MLSDGSPIAFVGCALPLLSDAATIMPPLPPVSMGGISFAAISAGTAACIDSPEVQDDPAAAGKGLGETFVGSNGNRFSITSGAPTCTFTGEGCDASLNLLQVDDVGTCLASLAAVDVTVEEPASIEAVAVVAVQELALTGEEHEFSAAFAGALVGTGLSILAFGRLLHIRRKND